MGKKRRPSTTRRRRSGARRTRTRARCRSRRPSPRRWRRARAGGGDGRPVRGQDLALERHVDPAERADHRRLARGARRGGVHAGDAPAGLGVVEEAGDDERHRLLRRLRGSGEGVQPRRPHAPADRHPRGAGRRRRQPGRPAWRGGGDTPSPPSHRIFSPSRPQLRRTSRWRCRPSTAPSRTSPTLAPVAANIPKSSATFKRSSPSTRTSAKITSAGSSPAAVPCVTGATPKARVSPPSPPRPPPSRLHPPGSTPLPPPSPQLLRRPRIPRVARRCSPLCLRFLRVPPRRPSSVLAPPRLLPRRTRVPPRGSRVPPRTLPSPSSGLPRPSTRLPRLTSHRLACFHAALASLHAAPASHLAPPRLLPRRTLVPPRGSRVPPRRSRRPSRPALAATPRPGG